MPPKRAKRLTAPEIVARLSSLYGEPVWRPHGDPMSELVLTILSQNTSDANSGRAFMRLRSRFGSWEDLLAADQEEIVPEIQVGGLARIKAPRIKAALAAVYQRRGSFDIQFLRELRLEEAKAWLRELKGVGPGLVPAKAGAAQAHDILEAILEPDEVYAFHISLIKHGRRICRAQQPLCERCPLLDGCPAGQGFIRGRSG